MSKKSKKQGKKLNFRWLFTLLNRKSKSAKQEPNEKKKKPKLSFWCRIFGHSLFRYEIFPKHKIHYCTRKGCEYTLKKKRQSLA